MANFKALPPGIALMVALCLPVPGSPEKCRVDVRTADGRAVRVGVEIARNDADRMRGLMHRTHLPENDGMLFIFEREEPLRFWMKDTPLPLAIAYISAAGRINDIHEMKPLDASVTYPSRHPAKYALEMNRGWFERHRIKPGDLIEFHGCLGK